MARRCFDLIPEGMFLSGWARSYLHNVAVDKSIGAAEKLRFCAPGRPRENWRKIRPLETCASLKKEVRTFLGQRCDAASPRDYQRIAEQLANGIIMKTKTDRLGSI